MFKTFYRTLWADRAQAQRIVGIKAGVSEPCLFIQPLGAHTEAFLNGVTHANDLLRHTAIPAVSARLASRAAEFGWAQGQSWAELLTNAGKKSSADFTGTWKEYAALLRSWASERKGSLYLPITTAWLLPQNLVLNKNITCLALYDRVIEAPMALEFALYRSVAALYAQESNLPPQREVWAALAIPASRLEALAEQEQAFRLEMRLPDDALTQGAKLCRTLQKLCKAYVGKPAGTPFFCMRVWDTVRWHASRLSRRAWEALDSFFHAPSLQRLRPMSGLIATAPPGAYLSTDTDPWFRLRARTPRGWVRVRWAGQAEQNMHMKLYFAQKDGVSEDNACYLGWLVMEDTEGERLVKIPRSTRYLRLDPGETATQFRLDWFTMKRAGILALGTKALRELFRRHSPYSFIRRGLELLRNEGLKGSLRRFKNANTEWKHSSLQTNYAAWCQYNEPGEKGIAQQTEEAKSLSPIVISLAVPVYKTDETMLRQLLDSLLAQTWPHWQICLADGGSAMPHIEQVLAEYKKKSGQRVQFTLLPENLGIAGNTNAALALCTGEWIGLCDHDDVLPPWALFEVAKAIQAYPNADMIYTDEDKISVDLGRRFDPHFKPDFNLDMLRTNNYICHLLVMKRHLWDKTGGFRPGFDGSQDYDLVLRASEMAAEIYHIPKVCYHWRCHEQSTAAGIGIKPYVIEATHKALTQHLQRMELDATVEEGAIPNACRVQYAIQGNPLVSIVIPNKDHITDLRLCLESLQKCTYTNLEILVVENNSAEPETFAFYAEAEAQYGIKMIRYEGEFNFARINNQAVEAAHGDHILFLNNDTEAITPDFIEQLLMFTQRSDVAAAGGLLFFPDDTIQHAGVVIGLQGIAGHIGAHCPRSDLGYFGRHYLTQNYSAVTAACMMVKRADFESVNGFDERFQVAFNDVDLCMKLTQMGKRIVYNPYCQLYHHESKSRGYENTPQKLARFNREIALFEEKWGERMQAGDPCYSPNFSLQEPFGL